MELIVLILFILAIGITARAIHDDKIFKGYNPEAVDRDGDGIIQEGTKYARLADVKAKRPVKKAAPKKKAAKKKK